MLVYLIDDGERALRDVVLCHGEAWPVIQRSRNALRLGEVLSADSLVQAGAPAGMGLSRVVLNLGRADDSQK